LPSFSSQSYCWFASFCGTFAPSSAVASDTKTLQYVLPSFGAYFSVYVSNTASIFSRLATAFGGSGGTSASPPLSDNFFSSSAAAPGRETTHRPTQKSSATVSFLAIMHLACFGRHIVHR
jgi:hypothetical protein